MKKFFLVLLFLPAIILSLPKDLSAQNGVTSFNMPTGYTFYELQNKGGLAIDNANNKWVGFKSIGLAKFDGTNWTMFNISNSLLPNDTVNALAFDGSNNLWIGTNNGLAKFDGTNWTIYNPSNSNIIGKFILSIATQGNNIWIGTKAGASKLNGTTFTNYSVSNSGLAGDTVQCFAFEPNGDIWIGTSHRLSRLSGTTWTTFSTLNSGLTGNNIQSLYFNAPDLWIGTIGLCKYLTNTIAPFATLFPSTTSFIYTTFYIYSIGKGPQGGVAYFQSGALIEIVNNKPIIYYLPNARYKTIPVYNILDNSFWFINQLAQQVMNKDLFSFDPQNYNGLGLGLTPNNIKYLDVNQVSTPILNRGDMSWDLTESQYEVPKGGGVTSVFASGLWIGGLDSAGNLHQAAMTYRTGCDFWPGPLDTTNGNVDTATAWQYDKIWKIDRFKIEEFIYYFNNGQVQNGNYIPDNDIITWPARGTGNHTRNLASFVDVNSNGIYDPMNDGDYPLIKGDQELYSIFNDNLAIHGQTGGTPLKVEVHASAYAFTCPTIVNHLKTMNYTTLYNFQIFNRSNVDYDSVHIGIFTEHDLGLYSDDFVACQPQYNFGFAYNGDSLDGIGPGTYGARPPISSTVVLNGPIAYPNDGVDNDNDGTMDELGEKNLMTCFHYFTGGCCATGHPNNAMAYYNYSRGRWRDSTHITYGGDGHNTGPDTNFMFPDLPYLTTGWTEGTSNNIPDDRRYVTGCGPFQFNAGSSVDLDYAIVYSRDTTIPYGTPAYYQQAINDVGYVTNWFNTNSFPSCLQLNVGMDPTSTSLNELNIYPNPTNDILNIEYKQTNLNTMMEIYDITGKQLFKGRLESFGKNLISVRDLSAGLYFIRIIDGDKVYAKKFIKE